MTKDQRDQPLLGAIEELASDECYPALPGLSCVVLRAADDCALIVLEEKECWIAMKWLDSPTARDSSYAVLVANSQMKLSRLREDHANKNGWSLALVRRLKMMQNDLLSAKMPVYRHAQINPCDGTESRLDAHVGQHGQIALLGGSEALFVLDDNKKYLVRARGSLDDVAASAGLLLESERLRAHGMIGSTIYWDSRRLAENYALANLSSASALPAAAVLGATPEYLPLVDGDDSPRHCEALKVVDIDSNIYLTPKRQRPLLSSQCYLVVERADGKRGLMEFTNRVYFDRDPMDDGWTAEAMDAIRSRRVVLGMTSDQVTLAWGSPSRINRTEASAGYTEQWVYELEKDFIHGYVYIERGLVCAIQTTE